MAKEIVKSEQEQTVEEKLIALGRLQETLSKIDKIKTLRGELPLEVQDLEDEIAGLETRLSNYAAESKAQTQAASDEKTKSANAKSLIEKYNSQLDHVKNNREYDNLKKEIEFQDLEIKLSEKKIKEYNEEVAQRKQRMEELKERMDGRALDLSAKKTELDSIVSETKQEEEKLRVEAKSLEESIEPRLLNAFKRIRKGARNGMAVVPVERDACGGCFNKIPPQKQLDVKLHKKVIVCEYCGRIMIDPELFENAK
ncbi:zinc ribbon domain-containing protein [Porphyromonas pogonae]|uniref:zinc ribbon domain-containing protein n=1 Tax=Porphyromonas pogonae TaxID=867595 RepID=UPI002E76F2ED|nr:C4-type zinc ribbon domain-containing protein [Porphyromonas pogonae]